MNIINHGDEYQVYSGGVTTYNKLPAQTYVVEFNKMRGFYLKLRHDLEISEQKIYGIHEKKVDKVMNSFNNIDRNFGVLLSGDKGIGKTLFLKMLAKRCISEGYPVISVTSPFPGLAEFLSEIDQECAVIFDEFEKLFNDEEGMQNSLLPLFDGLDGGHKMFIVTCNSLSRINDYMLNRPGRFHYHFMLKSPSPEEVREYLTDKLSPEYRNYIPDIVNISAVAEFTYDQLRAITFDLNQGYSLKETMGDINICHEESVFDSSITVNGIEYYDYGNYLDFSSDEPLYIRMHQHSANDAPECIQLAIIPKSVKIEGQNFIIPNPTVLGVYGPNNDDEKYRSIGKVVLKKKPSYRTAHYDI